jgi:hypothetical protein
LKVFSVYCFGEYFLRYWSTAFDCQEGRGKMLEKPPPE